MPSIPEAEAEPAGTVEPPRRFAIVQAPSGLGLRATGVEQLGRSLLARGFGRSIGALDPVVVPAPAATGVVEMSSGVMNALEIAQYSIVLADAVAAAIDAGTIPVVLGGDCSVLIGASLGARRRREIGLLFIDGHADFYQPSAEPSGEAASMDLALVTGHGAASLSDLEGRSPYVRADAAVAFGFRDAAEQVRDGSQPLPDDLLAIDLPAIRKGGIAAAVGRALGHLTRAGAPERFWLHVDADVLDDAIMPAVDYRIPAGLSADELGIVLAAAMSTGRVAGIDVTIYNPVLDLDGSAGAALNLALVAGLAADDGLT